MKDRPSTLVAGCCIALVCTVAAVAANAAASSNPPVALPMTMLIPECDADIDVIAAIGGGTETESACGDVFTDSEPFECGIVEGSGHTVTFHFDQTAVHSSSGCVYDITRTDKNSNTTLGNTEVLDEDRLTLHYSVTATPRSSMTECNGHSTIDVDPVVRLSKEAPDGITTETRNCS